MSCIACGRGFHDECSLPPYPEADEKNICCCEFEIDQASLSEDQSTDAKGSGLRGPRRMAEVSISGGRKRAAEVYPLQREEPCEWRGLANCGGGLFPVLGCSEGKQQARHHGPVKNTSVNHRENVHRICHKCHNRWHRANDPHYDRNDKEAESRFALLPHNPRPMEPIDLINETLAELGTQTTDEDKESD